MSTFADNLRTGQAGETLIAQWLRNRGYSVLPVYEKILDTGKGPQLFLSKSGSLIAPDILAFNSGRVIWFEAKHKTAFTWHRITSRWVTGIDRRHYDDYLMVAQKTPWPVWLLFLHEGGQAKDSPPDSPSGLFGNNLLILSGCVNHTSDKYGRSGMVYWAKDSLKMIATLAEVNGTSKHSPEETACARAYPDIRSKI